MATRSGKDEFEEKSLLNDSVSDTNTPNSNPNIKDLSKITFASAEAAHAHEQTRNIERNALKLVRCQISCNNRNKTSLLGEIFCARNAKIAEVKKFIPFNTPTHIPEILLNVIKEKQCQMFRKEKLPNGNQITKSYLIPEYSIEILPPLTSAELEAIKQKQLAEGRNN